MGMGTIVLQEIYHIFMLILCSQIFIGIFPWPSSVSSNSAVLGRHDGPLLFENLQESGQGSPDIGVVNGFALGDLVFVYHALGIKEDKDYLLRP
jgi:hypothetical protein